MYTSLCRRIIFVLAASVAAPFFLLSIKAQISFGEIPIGVGGFAADGTIAGGADNQAYRLTRGSVPVALPPLPGKIKSTASAISNNGAVIVGTVMNETNTVTEAVRWTSNTVIGLGNPDGMNTYSVGLSGDGSVVAGTIFGPPTVPGEAFRWTQTSGLVGLGHLPGRTSSNASGISNDGSTIVGSSFGGSSFPLNSFEAFRWTANAGMVGLGHFSGGITSFANAVSADGSVITGFADMGGLNQAFRWTPSGGMVGLGNFGSAESQGLAISGDGSIIVGITDLADGVGGFIVGGFMWTSSTGIRDFSGVLSDLGIKIFATELIPYAISPDGRYVAGSGWFAGQGRAQWLLDRGPQGFSPVPEPSTYGLASALLIALAVVRRRRTRTGSWLDR